MEEEQLIDIWQRILDNFCSFKNLEKTSSDQGESPRAQTKQGRPPGKRSRDEAGQAWYAGGISDIERRSRGTIAMDWTDATHGHYGEQLWSLGVARRKSICALSGETINRGDSIYRPRQRGRNTPTNAAAMILASFLDAQYFSGTRSRDHVDVTC